MNDLNKKLCAAFLSVFTAFQLFACSPLTEAPFDNEPSTAEVLEHHLETVESETDYDVARFAYVGNYDEVCLGTERASKLKMGYKSLLTQEQRAFYDIIAKNVFYISKETNENNRYYIKQIAIENCRFTETQLRFIITAFTEDYPQIFWLSDIFGYTSAENQTVLQLYSQYGLSEIRSKISEINAVIGDFAKKIPFGLNDYEREKAVHNLLLDNCKYADGVIKIDDDFDAFGIYGALVKKQAVCEGYARAFQWLMSLAGIECVNIVGNNENILHMWNAVRLSGKWYYVDSTWDDTGDYARYDYFNITTDELLENKHTLAPLFSELTDSEICGTDGTKIVSFNLFIPQCTSVENSYIEVDAVKLNIFSDYNTNMIVQRFYKALKNNEPFIEIVINIPDVSYDEAVERLIDKNGGKIFTYIKSANSMYFGKQIDTDRVSVIEKANRSILTVILRYK